QRNLHSTPNSHQPNGNATQAFIILFFDGNLEHSETASLTSWSPPPPSVGFRIPAEHSSCSDDVL
ncbi:hypothetical protein CMV_030809, partial [Castanea mollissima]